MKVHRSSLVTWTTGDAAAFPVLLLHDRYEDHNAVDGIAAKLRDDRLVVSIRSARTQMSGTDIHGYYWFLGPFDHPELSTLGDGLQHLEALLLSVAEGRPDGSISIVGKGEGGTMALLMALLWPNLLTGAASIGGPLPQNLGALPVELNALDSLPVLLGNLSLSDKTGGELRRRGAILKQQPTVSDSDVAHWLRGQSTPRE